MSMNNSQKTWSVLAIVIIFVVIGTAGFYMYYTKYMKPNWFPHNSDQPAMVTDQTPASKCGLTVESPLSNSAVSFPLTVTGKIDNSNANEAGCAWAMFEGQAGVAKLYYETKDGWSLAEDTKPIMVENWMSTSTPFTVTLNFDNTKEEFPSGYNFKVVLEEENPSGEGTPDTLELPLTLK